MQQVIQHIANDSLGYRHNFPDHSHMTELAKKEIWVSGVGLDRIALDCGILERKLRDPSFKLRLMALSPDAALIEETNQYFDHESTSTHNLGMRLEFNLNTLYQRLVQQHPTQVEIKVTPFRPACGYFIVDANENDGFMMVVLYLYRLWDNDARPMVKLGKITRADWFETCLRDFENLWNEAEPYPKA